MCMTMYCTCKFMCSYVYYGIDVLGSHLQVTRAQRERSRRLKQQLSGVSQRPAPAVRFYQLRIPTKLFQVLRAQTEQAPRCLAACVASSLLALKPSVLGMRLDIFVCYLKRGIVIVAKITKGLAIMRADMSTAEDEGLPAAVTHIHVHVHVLADVEHVNCKLYQNFQYMFCGTGR